MAKLVSFAVLLAAAIAVNGAGVGFAPYFDMTLDGGPNLLDVARQSNQKSFTLAFALGGHLGCEPMWGGQKEINDAAVLAPVKQLLAEGGEMIIATGGAMGPYLEHICGTPEALADAYKKVLDTVGTRHLDIDVEAPIPLDIMNNALLILQRDRPETTLSFTLMIQGEDYGLTPELGVKVLEDAVRKGVRVDIVNAMTMEFGGSSPTWGETCANAAEAVLGQMKVIWPGKSETDLLKMLGVTPMIGRNFNGRVLEVSDARYLVDWANRRGIGHLSFWSSARDNGGCPGNVSPQCSGAVQNPFEFTSIFQQFVPRQ